MNYEGCKYCMCEDCPNECKCCKECNAGIDAIGWCKVYRELGKEKQLSLFK